MLRLPPVVVVTGTGTGVGKTVATAALAGPALAAGRSVCVVKPVQTGFAPGQERDAGGARPDTEEVRHLLGGHPRMAVREFLRLPEPLAPEAAARAAGVDLPPVERHAADIAPLVRDFDLVLVEGAGGLLVRLDGSGGTVADLARSLPGAEVVVVTGPELGTLNVTGLTVEALERRDVPVLGLVIGRWPAEPGAAELSNLTELPRLTGVPLLGVVPVGPPTPPFLVADPRG
jgi:dethiobiotin synthetase